jgi:squalene-associated FAD-dependent desaturase
MSAAEAGGAFALPAAAHVAVIGGGWAGCAAAVELIAQGKQVTLFESSRTLGGRARRVEHEGMVLDNGQHILLGAYRETLRLMQQVGVDLDDALLRLRLQMRYPADSGGMDFIAPALPAPLHLLVALLRADGLKREDKMALARFSSLARWMDWRLNIDCTVAELLARFDQTPRLIQLMWRPLCLAALNTSPDAASAQVFLNVLRDSLGARRAASDMLLPRRDLSALFPQPTQAYITAQGGQVALGVTVQKIAQKSAQVGPSWQIDSEAGSQAFDAVIVATPARQAARLLDGLVDAGQFDFTYEPITTVYLKYAPQVKLARPFYALLDAPELAQWGQFVFDRGALDTAQAGLLAVVVSASGAAIEQGHEALCAAVIRQLSAVLRMPELATPVWTQVISEKRATFACTPGLLRPATLTRHQGLLIAGDYTAGDYPATLEGAVRSGMAAARALIESGA